MEIGISGDREKLADYLELLARNIREANSGDEEDWILSPNEKFGQTLTIHFSGSEDDPESGDAILWEPY